MFSPDPDSPAFDVVQHATCAEYADVEALELFANDVDVITYEFENVPAATAMVLAARRPVLPAQKILETTQDRLVEKDFVKRLGIGTADYADVLCDLRRGRAPDDVVATAKASLAEPLDHARLGGVITRFLSERRG